MSGSAEDGADDLLPPIEEGVEGQVEAQNDGDSGQEAPSAPAERGTVPLGAVQVERERRQQAEKRARQLEETLARGNERLQQLLERQLGGQQAEKAPEVPDFNTDPAAHLRARAEQAERSLSELSRERQEASRAQQLAHTFNNAAQRVMQDHPDFRDAYAHVWNSLVADAAIVGIPPQVMEQRIVEAALAAGENPAQRMYELARVRGFTGKAQQPKASADDKMQVLERGSAAARNLPPGGAPARQPLSLETLANMSQDEFSELNRKDPKLVARILKGVH